MSSFFSVEYLLLLLPITVLAYWIFPQWGRRVTLLLASYACFWAISGELLVYLLVSTLSIHSIGLWLEATMDEGKQTLQAVPQEERKSVRIVNRRQQRLILAFGILIQLCVLLVLKYGAFFIKNLNGLSSLLNAPISLTVPSILLPIGISFYTMQAMSYLFDVYRGKIHADRNLLRVALYMSFFPQLMEGPICRYSETAYQLWQAPPLVWQNVILGAQRILWGLMKKLVVADRLNLFIKNVFDGYENYDGFVIAVAVVCYTIQLYMDFSGTMDLVLGSGQIFGMNLPENFRRPFFSKTIPEFWKRWHITLGAWFRDYIFYPVSLSAPLKKLALRARKKLGSHYGALSASGGALLCVWLCNGLWHGAGWNYIFFGLYHFVLIFAGNIIERPVHKLTERLRINRDTRPFRWVQIVRTTLLVCVGELFFRANGLAAGLAMAQKVVTEFTLSTLWDQSLFTFGMDQKDFLVVITVLLVIFLVSLLQEKGCSIRQWISNHGLPFRVASAWALILFIVIFGAYGAGYVPVDPIYAGF